MMILICSIDCLLRLNLYDSTQRFGHVSRNRAVSEP